MKKKIFTPALSILLVGCLVFLSYPDEMIAFAKSSKKSTADTCKEICDEGIVMLKNDGGLPLTEKKLNIFGLGGCDNGWYYQGNGSGAGTQANRVSLYQAFREKGFAINEELANAYNNCGLSNHVPVTEDPKINYQIHETNNEFVTSKVDQAKSFSNQALVVISRYGGEGNDLPKFQYKNISGTESYDKDRIYSQLTLEEEQMIATLNSKNFEIYVLFNTCNPMQMGFIDNDYIKGALYMPMGGNSGAYCVPDVMSGEVNPSGHLTDIVPYDFKIDPTFPNMSYEYDSKEPDKSFENRYNTKRFGDAKDEYIHYAAYEENIYHGYWYYETAFLDDNLYKQKVQYPFGYGMSYSKFEWNLFSTTFDTDKVIISGTVKNTSDKPGKDVVQLYVHKPYEGKIEKPEVQLVRFLKTKELGEGDVETFSFTVPYSELADYDCYDKNKDGFVGYKLDGGKYTFSLRTDSHNIKNQGDSKTEKCIASGTLAKQSFKEDPQTRHKVTNLFTTGKTDSGLILQNTDKHPKDGRCASIDGFDFGTNGIVKEYMSRKDNFAHFPEGYASLHPMMGKGTAKDDYEKTYKVLDPWQEEVPKHKQEQKVEITIDNVDATNIKDPSWEKLMDSLSLQEMEDLVVKGGFQTIAIPKINKKLSIDKDGPCGFAGGVNGSTATPSNFPSDSMVGSTWNYQMAYKFGLAIGDEGVNRLGGINGCYGPGLDLHRSPLGGRNFEYYSEDPYLSGILCSYQITGCMDEGMYCYVKHIAMNDSDMGRNGRYNFATEQTFRQVYAKPFEIIAKGADKFSNYDKEIEVHKANAAMGSVDRLGSTRTTGSYNFLNEMLRGEWGFQGSVITDFYQSGNVNDVDEGIRSGNDLMLNGANNCEVNDKTSDTYKHWVREAAKNILFTYANTKAIAKRH
ncbi:MAG: glycoside hydrolase family 3 C-terminal domain-containing protein [Coriobacteriia bacterium]|nr:glycoside hydrolase family 3 C-terminal domain-containing protein [Coriobacteriia bacterium]